MRLDRRVWIALLLGAAVGCSSGSSGGGGSGSGSSGGGSSSSGSGGGSGGGGSGGSSSSGSGGSTFCCQINGSAWNCPNQAALNKCADFGNPDPSSCTSRSSPCPGTSSGGSGGGSGSGGSSGGTCGTGTGGQNAPCVDCTECMAGYACVGDPSSPQGLCTKMGGSDGCTSSADCNDPSLHCCVLSDGTSACIPQTQDTGNCN